VAKRFGRTRALDGFSLEVPAGSITGLVGSNGAGKTTAMAIAGGMTMPDAGAAIVFGEGPFDPDRHAGRLALLPQDSELPREGRPRELLSFYGRLQGLDARTAAAEADRMLGQVHLTDRARSAARTLSHGMRKRIMIAQCFLGAPEVVLLDEPLSGLDPREVAHMRDFIVAQRKRRTIVISSHNLHEIELLCDHVAFVEKGRTVRSGPIDTITGSRGLLVYTLGAGARPPGDALEAAVAGASFVFDAEEGTLTCRFDADRATPDAVNALVLRLLLDAAIPILAVTQGARLESEYLRHSA
jgi:ABC-2 type transport system ATP-binding protein